MGKKNDVTVLKKGAPKLREVKDFDAIYSVDVHDVSALREVFKAAIPQLGRELAKNHGYSNTVLTNATGIAVTMSGTLASVADAGYYSQQDELAQAAGYERDSWTVTNKCGDTKRFDWSDLYEPGTEVEVVIRVSKKLKSAKDLAEAGVK